MDRGDEHRMVRLPLVRKRREVVRIPTAKSVPGELQRSLRRSELCLGRDNPPIFPRPFMGFRTVASESPMNGARDDWLTRLDPA